MRLPLLLLALGALASLPIAAPPASAQQVATLPRVCSTDTSAGRSCVKAQPVQIVDNTGAIVGAALPVTTCATLTTRQVCQLATANTASPPATLYGGDYIFRVACSSFGSVDFQELGPDGSTWLTDATKTANGVTGVAVGAAAVVRVQLNGTAGCSIALARVPS